MLDIAYTNDNILRLNSGSGKRQQVVNGGKWLDHSIIEAGPHSMHTLDAL